MTGSASYHDKDCSCHSSVFTSKDDADVITGAVYIKPVPYMEADTKKCPDDYYYYGNVSCFRFFGTLVNHGTAVQVCQQQNASLIKIDSDDKQEHVNQYLDWHPAELVHIQGYRGLEDDSWFFEDGNEMEFNNWNERQPVNDPQNSHIVMDILEGGGHWSNVNPEYVASSLCEIYI
ncbi:NKG2-D type II integral membrane protein-like [Mytilus californianus]|uniref:NKG2-D type II integral membrane protein-like n=1 Tax=Mytilus californianus TaxID=6549 RepID=UPI002245FDE3|nr:NKG2-D type II integral membrane protein-like [Mytilus californianus]